MKQGEDAREPEPPLFGSSFTDVSADFTLGRRLGTGNFAKVVLGHLKRPMPHWKLAAGDGAAIKVIKKPSSRRAVERVELLRAEVQILRSIQHPNIVRLYDVYESPNRLYLVMELLTGGELFDRIVGLGKFSEDDARYFTFKMLNAVLYLHDRNICHRDLKPENILLATPEPDAELKITDFGLSKISALPDDFLMTTRCGTPGYVAPEVLAQEVLGQAADPGAAEQQREQ
jgi:calcium/calmodulin-dependent protein kinase I